MLISAACARTATSLPVPPGTHVPIIVAEQGRWYTAIIRPLLAAAIVAAKKAKATLIIAKLDRLARNVHFISGLMESGVDFVAADNPHANKLMVHLLAAFAEHWYARGISLEQRKRNG